MNTFTSPVYHVHSIELEKIHANSYNPNHVAPPEFELLQTSILEDGYTQPIVCSQRQDGEYEIVDGYHRYLAMKLHNTTEVNNKKFQKNAKKIYHRENGRLPVVLLEKTEPERMASTIRHNRARGTHSVDLMQKMVAELVAVGQSDPWIQKHLGMSQSELLRLKQLTGIASLFVNSEYTPAENTNDNYEDNQIKSPQI